MSTISKEEVKKVADLAKIKLTDAELKKYAKELGSILDYVQKVNEVDTENVKFESHVDLKNVMRKDSPEKSLSQDDALLNRKKAAHDGYFTVRTVLNK